MLRQGAAAETAGQNRPDPLNGLDTTPQTTDEFLAYQEQKESTSGTLLTYRRNLELLYSHLQETKRLECGMLDRWQAGMYEEGCAARTVNVRISTANSLSECLGRQEFQTWKLLEPGGKVQPDLTRSEYLRLLPAARVLSRERTYLLRKLFGGAGLTIQALPKVTVEAVKAGKLIVSGGNPLCLPVCLREELLDYAKRKGIVSGPVFISGDGKALHRSNLSASFRHLCRDAQVSEEKDGLPRCLRRLYQTPQAGVVSNISVIVEQERPAIGWKQEENG